MKMSCACMRMGIRNPYRSPNEDFCLDCEVRLKHHKGICHGCFRMGFYRECLKKADFDLDDPLETFRI